MSRSPIISSCQAVPSARKITAALTLLTLMAAGLTVSQAQSGSGLPEWNKRDAERFDEPGSVMLGNGLWPLNPDGSSTRPSLDPELAALKEKLRGGDRILASDHVRPSFPLSIIEPNSRGRSLRPPPLNVRPTPLYLSQSESLPEGLLEAYFDAKKPALQLIDPQGFLTQQDSEEILEVLRAHQTESPLDIYLMILGPSQTLPNSVPLSTLHHRWFGEKPAAIVVYHMQAPEKTRFEFGDKIHESLPATAIDRATYSCIREAQTTGNPIDQIKRLASETSIRLFWMTSVIEGKHPVGSPILTEQNKAEPKQSFADQSKNFFIGIWPAVQKTLIVIALLILAAFAGYAAWVWRRDAITGRPIRFPERDLPMRLGGSHAGGTYIGMTFAAPSAPKKQN